ncbi:MAG: hypothetical protein JNL11_17855 [Bdellovibrionaceae bacterium]|nr:hypothetical protein [Pseudobdellovibrionaceae bacterium]
MKVLFASLSRIGDYIQHMVLVQAWQKAHPDVEVHVLVNDLIPVDLLKMNAQYKHFILPRFEYQKRINHAATPLIYPFLSLKKIVHQLRSEHYTLLFDLSLQHHSAELLKLIDDTFSYTETEKSVVNEYLNRKDQTHLIDKLKKIYDIELTPKSALSSKTHRILFQLTTSDMKKNIDLARWRPIVDSLKFRFPWIEISILGAKSERNLLQSVFKPSDILICDFSHLGRILDSGTRLISLDTSIKHFAALFHVPTIEISVGSSHWIKNAAYQAGNIIFSADFHCRPCGHSSECPYGRNRCQDEINFDHLQDVLFKWVTNTNVINYPIKTMVRDGSLGVHSQIFRGEKWKQKTSQINLSY